MAVQNGRCGLEQRGEIVAQSQAVFFVFFLQGPIWNCGPPKVTQQGSGPAVLFHNCFRKRDGSKPWISEKSVIFETQNIGVRYRSWNTVTGADRRLPALTGAT